MYNWDIWYFDDELNTWVLDKYFFGTHTDVCNLVHKLNRYYENRHYEAERVVTETTTVETDSEIIETTRTWRERA